jgi:hypothetical protein
VRTPGPALILCLPVLAGCGADFATLEPANPTRVADGLVVTRADGSSYEVNDAVAQCRTDPDHPGVQIVRLIAPAEAASERRRETFLYAEVVPGVLGTRELPLDERDSGAGPSDLTLFGVDSQTRNELSGSSEDAAGTVTVVEATCDPEPRIAIHVDATLASEVGQPDATVRGSLASVSGR